MRTTSSGMIMQTAIANDKEYESVVAEDKEIALGTYTYGGNTLTYAVEEIAPSAYAYDARIVTIAKESMLGKEQADIEAEEARVAGLLTQVQNNIKG